LSAFRAARDFGGVLTAKARKPHEGYLLCSLGDFFAFLVKKFMENLSDIFILRGEYSGIFCKKSRNDFLYEYSVMTDSFCNFWEIILISWGKFYKRINGGRRVEINNLLM
jgi:hypothetical protein